MSIKREHKGLYLTLPNNHGLQAHFEEEEDTLIGDKKILKDFRYKGVKEIIGEKKKMNNEEILEAAVAISEGSYRNETARQDAIAIGFFI